MNQTIENIIQRRSCRKFLNKQISDEELNAVLEAGLYAPSGMGKQSPLFIVVQDKEVIAELSKINTALWKKGPDGFFGAPTLIIVLSSPQILHTYIQDGMACVQNMLIAAESLGLGAACISRAKQGVESEYGKKLLAKLGIEEHYEGIEHIILGYRDGEKISPPKRHEKRIFKV